MSIYADQNCVALPIGKVNKLGFNPLFNNDKRAKKQIFRFRMVMERSSVTSLLDCLKKIVAAIKVKFCSGGVGGWHCTEFPQISILLATLFFIFPDFVCGNYSENTLKSVRQKILS